MRKLKSLILDKKYKKSYKIYGGLQHLGSTQCLPIFPRFCPMLFTVKSPISSDMFPVTGEILQQL